jgi:hypothetical protein
MICTATAELFASKLEVSKGREDRYPFLDKFRIADHTGIGGLRLAHDNRSVRGLEWLSTMMQGLFFLVREGRWVAQVQLNVMTRFDGVTTDSQILSRRTNRHQSCSWLTTTCPYASRWSC